MTVADTPGAGERQPLLPPPEPVSDQDIHDEENPENLASETAKDIDEPKRKRSWWAILWYTILAGLGIFLTVIFIKGFIEADDVDVSYTTCRYRVYHTQW